MSLIYKIFRVTFFVFLDVSGILLGIFLILLGLGIALEWWDVSSWMGWLLFALGICAFMLHTGHYFNLRYMRWIFGKNYFLKK